MNKNLILLTVASLLFFSGMGLVYLNLRNRSDPDQGYVRSTDGQVWRLKRMMTFGVGRGEWIAIYEEGKK